MSATLYSTNAPYYGLVADSLQIEMSAENPTLLTIPVTAFITEDFSKLGEKALANAPQSDLSTDKIDLGNVSSSVSEPIHQTAILSNTGKNALIVRRIYSPDHGVTATIGKEKIKHGDKTTVTITISPEFIHNKEIINTSFVLITNDPAACPNGQSSRHD